MGNTIIDMSDGEYIVDIVEMQSSIDTKNRKLVVWVLKLVEGAHAGCTFPKNFYLTTPKVVDFMKKELLLVGISANSAEDFESKKSQAYGKRIRIEALTNEQGFRVYYVKGVIGQVNVTPAVAAKDIGW